MGVMHCDDKKVKDNEKNYDDDYDYDDKWSCDNDDSIDVSYITGGSVGEDTKLSLTVTSFLSLIIPPEVKVEVHKICQVCPVFPFYGSSVKVINGILY